MTVAPIGHRDASPPVEYATFESVAAMFGLSRSRQYTLAGAGLIRVVRIGGRSRVEVASVRGYMASLPAAPIRAKAA